MKNKEIVNEVLKEIMKQDNIEINLLKLRKSIENALEVKEKEMLDDEIKFLEQPHIKGNNIDIRHRIKELKQEFEKIK